MLAKQFQNASFKKEKTPAKKKSQSNNKQIYEQKANQVFFWEIKSVCSGQFSSVSKLSLQLKKKKK